MGKTPGLTLHLAQRLGHPAGKGQVIQIPENDAVFLPEQVERWIGIGHSRPMLPGSQPLSSDDAARLRIVKKRGRVWKRLGQPWLLEPAMRQGWKLFDGDHFSAFARGLAGADEFMPGMQTEAFAQFSEADASQFLGSQLKLKEHGLRRTNAHGR